jgi:hypothetical protein
MSGLLADLSLKISANTAELNSGLNKAKASLNKFQKTGKTAGKQVKQSMGTIKGAFTNMASSVTGQLGGLAGQLGGMSTGFMEAFSGVKSLSKGMGTFKTALIGTGIGALVVALGSLVTYLSKTAEGQDLVNTAMNLFNAVVATVMQRVGYLGKALVKLFQGDLQGAADLANKAVEDLGATVKKNYKEEKGLSEAENKLKRDRIALIEKEKVLNAEISKLRREAEDEDLAAEQRLVLINQAIVKEKELHAEKSRIAKAELKILETRAAMGDNTLQDEEELAKARGKVFDLEKEHENVVRTLQRRQTSITKEVEGQDKALKDSLATVQKIQAELDKEPTIDYSDLEQYKPENKTIVPVEFNYDEPPEENVSEKDAEVLANLKKRYEEAHSYSQEKLAESQYMAQATASLISGTLSSTFAQIGEGLGDALSGKGGVSDILNGLLMQVIEFGKTFGKLLVSLGVAKISLEKIGISGVGAVIAGTALIALTGAINNHISKGVQKFANGGIVGGSSYSGDKVVARVNSGEMVLNKGQQSNLFSMINNGGSGTGQNMNLTATVRGEDIYLALDEYNRRSNRSF